MFADRGWRFNGLKHLSEKVTAAALLTRARVVVDQTLPLELTTLKISWSVSSARHSFTFCHKHLQKAFLSITFFYSFAIVQWNVYLQRWIPLLLQQLYWRPFTLLLFTKRQNLIIFRCLESAFFLIYICLIFACQTCVLGTYTWSFSTSYTSEYFSVMKKTKRGDFSSEQTVVSNCRSVIRDVISDVIGSSQQQQPCGTEGHPGDVTRIPH